MSPSTTTFQLAITIYIVIIPVSATPYKNGFGIMELQNNSNVNTDHHYNDTHINDPTYTDNNCLDKNERANARKCQTARIQIWKGHVTDNNNGRISRSVSFKKEQEIATLLGSQQNNLYHFHHEKLDRSEVPSHIKTDKTTELLPTQVSLAQPSALAKLLVDKKTLTSEHILAKDCKNASDSAKVPPVVRLLNYIAERYLYHCISVILYDDFYEEELHLLQALLNTYPLTYIHGKVGKHGLTDPPDMRCRDFVLLVRNLKTVQTAVGGHSISRVIVVAQASTWRIREFLSSRLSQNLVNLLVIGNQNQVSHGSGINSKQNLNEADTQFDSGITTIIEL
jgi:hypothetical protein